MCLIIGIAALFLMAELVREQLTFKTTAYEIPFTANEAGDEPLKIVFLSDLHNHVYGKSNDTLIKAIASLSPDLILIGGDMLVGKKKAGFKKALTFCKNLPQIAPTYYALGNHEQRMKEEPEKYNASFAAYKDELTRAGIYFLENESEIVDLKGRGLCLAGLEIPLSCNTHFHKGHLELEEVEERIGTCPSSYTILMAHNPSYVSTYLKWGADMVLSGHYHGGLVRIPGMGGIISPDFTVFPRYSGEYTKVGKQHVIVSKGLGTHTFHIRFIDPAEIVLLKLK